LPAVYANVLGPIPELDYPIFLLAHRDVRRVPRVSAVFDFCVRELKPVLTRGEMKRSPQGDRKHVAPAVSRFQDRNFTP
jgi:hypothetical protein